MHRHKFALMVAALALVLLGASALIRGRSEESTAGSPAARRPPPHSTGPASLPAPPRSSPPQSKPTNRPPRPTETTDGGVSEPTETTTDSGAGGSESPSSATRPQEPSAGRPVYANRKQFEHRCRAISAKGARAEVVYEAGKKMTVGTSAVVRAAVTLNEGAPPKTVLPRTDAAGAPGVVVACRIRARLSSSKYEFDIDDRSSIVDHSFRRTPFSGAGA